LSKAFDRDVFAECLTTIELGKVYMTPQHANEPSILSTKSVVRKKTPW